MSPAAVATKNAAQAGKEAKEQGDQCAENQPISDPPGRIDSTIAHVTAGDAEEDHLDDPDDEGDKESQGADKCHEDGSRTVVRGTAETE